jgi:hypothetical protein
MIGSSRSLIVIGLIIGCVIGFGFTQIRYQPQILQLQSDVDQKTEAFDAVQLEIDTVQSEFDSVQTELDTVQIEKKSIETSYQDLQSDYIDLETQYSTLYNETQHTNILSSSYPGKETPSMDCWYTIDKTSEMIAPGDSASFQILLNTSQGGNLDIDFFAPDGVNAWFEGPDASRITNGYSGQPLIGTLNVDTSSGTASGRYEIQLIFSGFKMRFPIGSGMLTYREFAFVTVVVD